MLLWQFLYGHLGMGSTNSKIFTNCSSIYRLYTILPTANENGSPKFITILAPQLVRPECSFRNRESLAYVSRV